jgi:hypothetical protein
LRFYLKEDFSYAEAPIQSPLASFSCLEVLPRMMLANLLLGSSLSLRVVSLNVARLHFDHPNFNSYEWIFVVYVLFFIAFYLVNKKQLDPDFTHS